MRSLRVLGTEPCLIVSRRPERTEVGTLAKRAGEAREEVRTLLFELFSELRDQPANFFDNDAGVERTVLTNALGKIEVLDNARVSVEAIFADMPDAIADTRERLTDLINAQAAARSLADKSELGAQAFGPQWEGATSDWITLKSAAA